MMCFLFFRFLGLLVGTFVQLIPNEENNSHNSKNCIEAGALGKWNERLCFISISSTEKMRVDLAEKKKTEMSTQTISRQ